MGVAHLWEILEDIKSHVRLEDLTDKTFAVDLATWICESESVKPLKESYARPYLRNLFFRVSILMSVNVHLVFVLDGKAPELKLGTVARRLGSSSTSPKKLSSGIRSRLNRKLNECCNLLDSLDIPWIRAEGEAESLCADLNKIGLVDGVITNDSDAFLYGAKTVVRNFSSEKNCALEMYEMKVVEEKLGFNRNDLIALSLLLGCDYCPKGVSGVGAVQATKLISSFKGIDSLEVLSNWRHKNLCHNSSYSSSKSVHCSACGHEGSKKEHAVTGCKSCREKCKEISSYGKVRLQAIKCVCDWHSDEKKRKLYDLEVKVKTSALQDPSFPNQSIIEEFSKQQKYTDAGRTIPTDPRGDLERLKTKFQESSPWIEKASRYLASKLDWNLEYAFAKVLPLLTRFLLTHPLSPEPQIELDSIMKKRVRNFTPSLEVKWKVLNDEFLQELPDSVEVTTVETELAMEEAFPNEVRLFHGRLEQEKKDKKRTKAKSKAIAKKSELETSDAKITDFFKVKKGRKIAGNQKTSRSKKSSNDSDLQSLPTSRSIVDCQSKVNSAHCKKPLDEDKENGVVVRKTKVMQPIIIFSSSDSEQESEGDVVFVVPHVDMKSKCTGRRSDARDTPQTDGCDATFSADINFSLGTSALNCLDDSVAILQDNAPTIEAQSSSTENLLNKCSSTNFTGICADVLRPQAATPDKPLQSEKRVSDSPVFMTLMERINARKKVNS